MGDDTLGLGHGSLASTRYYRRVHRLVFASLVLGPLAAPGVASACDDCLAGWQVIEPAFTDEVPADGVLAFFTRGGGELSRIAIEVRPAGGEALAGALERSGALIVWRPAEALEVGQSYSVQMLGLNGTYEECYEYEDLEADAAFTAIAPLGPLRPEPRWDAISVRHWVEVHPSTALDELVCCEGSYPGDSYCGRGATVEGCAATRGEARLHGEFIIDPSARAEALGQIEYLRFSSAEDRVEEIYGLYSDEPYPFPCAELTAIDLITGEELAGPTICPDPALQGELGEVVLDPRATLQCEELHTCEIRDTDVFTLGWDPESCRRWRGEGCGCVADEPRPTGPLWLWLWLGLLALKRRSRP